jgi:serine/threonine protein phosphatase PrpC
MLEIDFGQATHPGKLRANNEDATGLFVPRSRQEARARGWLFVLADGVGGLEMGEVASARTVQVITEGFAESPENTSLLGLLPRLIQHANAAVHDEGFARERRGRLMASTVVACAIRHDQAYVAHVGDSRCYHIRGSAITAVTTDHTVAGEQSRQGLISSEEAEDSETRHVLSRALGPELYVTADSTSVTLRAGDFLVLCCDGVYAGVDPSEMVRILAQPRPPQMLAEELVGTAVENDGSDNTTAQVIAVRSVEPMAMYRGRLYPRLN